MQMLATFRVTIRCTSAARLTSAGASSRRQLSRASFQLRRKEIGMNLYKNTVTGAEFWSESECKGGDWIKVPAPVVEPQKKPAEETEKKTGRKKKS
jgi:hypothetical protein